jgi:hypothetical protein
LLFGIVNQVISVQQCHKNGYIRFVKNFQNKLVILSTQFSRTCDSAFKKVKITFLKNLSLRQRCREVAICSKQWKLLIQHLLLLFLLLAT